MSLGHKESRESWLEHFRSLVSRGLPSPLTVTSDGAPGLIAAIEAMWPESERIRCWFHKMKNILEKVPQEMHEQIKRLLQDIRDAPDHATGQKRAKEMIERYGKQWPSAMDCLGDDLEASLATRDFEPALRLLVGQDAPLSPSTISRLTGQFKAQYEAFDRQDLHDRTFVYIWTDGIYLKAGLGTERVCLMVLIGADTAGQKHLSHRGEAVVRLEQYPRIVFCSSSVLELAHREQWTNFTFEPIDVLKRHRFAIAWKGIDYLAKHWPPKQWYPPAPSEGRTMHEWLKYIRTHEALSDRTRDALLDFGEAAVAPLLAMLNDKSLSERARFNAAYVLTRFKSEFATEVSPATKEQIQQAMSIGHPGPPGF